MSRSTLSGGAARLDAERRIALPRNGDFMSDSRGGTPASLDWALRATAPRAAARLPGSTSGLPGAPGGRFEFAAIHPYRPGMLLAAVNFDSPLFWAVVIGWILSVTLHELAHGVVASAGGDYTIGERGGLTLNPLYYVDPLNSLILPTVFLILGGIPLPGGATYIRTDLLRSRAWEAGVALAGPAANLLLCLAFALPLHPMFDWYKPGTPVSAATPGQLFCATMAVLQFLAVCFNLVPVPPLDGFKAIAPLLRPETELKLSTPPTSTMLFFGYFFALWQIPAILAGFVSVFLVVVAFLGFGRTGQAIIAMFAETLFR
jgi:Zn-dependent protease